MHSRTVRRRGTSADIQSYQAYLGIGFNEKRKERESRYTTAHSRVPMLLFHHHLKRL